MRDLDALSILFLASLMLLAVVTVLAADRFAPFALAAAGLAHAQARRPQRRSLFRGGSAKALLRRKEWTLLARDPWLASQTLMQLFYLLPPALLLWKNFHEEAGSLTLIAPVLVMAAGQLAGGLAWLAISGEDAPELVATAPVARGLVMQAKIEAVIIAVCLPIMPFVLALAFVSPRIALITLAGVALAAGSSTAIQLFFRTQARRTAFRRRQTSSRAATFAEALSSINWAATAAMAAAGTWLAVLFGLVSIGILLGARLIAPRPADGSLV
jgi:ABC-2 type transport system permease protein